MRIRHLSSFVVLISLLAVLSYGSAAFATTVPFVEDFSSDVSNWRDGAPTAMAVPLAFETTGGPDGSSYATTGFSFENSAAMGTPAIFRGQDGFDSSQDAFVGNWIADGVGTLTAQVRHNAPQPLTFFARIAKPANFPAGTAIQFAPVLPNTWTQLSFAIAPTNPQFVSFEGSNFGTVFSGIGNIQFGVSVPAGLAGTTPTYTFDLDQVALTAAVPEPTSLFLAFASLLGLVGFRYRTKR